MKKLLLVLFAFCLIPFAHSASYGSATVIDNKDEANIIRTFTGIRNLYIATIGFTNLDTIDIRSIYIDDPLTKNEEKEFKKRFIFSTKNKQQVAVIKYKSDNCDNLKNIKEKLIGRTLITEGEPISCKNNVWTAELNN